MGIVRAAQLRPQGDPWRTRARLSQNKIPRSFRMIHIFLSMLTYQSTDTIN